MLKSVNVGISEKGLHLREPILNMLLLHLLIPWDEIKYQKLTQHDNKNKPYTFYLNNSMTSIRLYPRTIEQLQQDYGEPIFFNKLGELQGSEE